MTTLVGWFILILTTFVVNEPLKRPLVDSNCYPLDVDAETRWQEYDDLLVIPYLDIVSASELSKAKIISIRSSRYNEYITCMWKMYYYLSDTDEIDYVKIQMSIKNNYARQVGDTGSGKKLSGLEAEKVVSLCRNINEDQIQVKVVLTRNCVLRQIKDFANRTSD